MQVKTEKEAVVVLSGLNNDIERLNKVVAILQPRVDKLAKDAEENYKKNVAIMESSEKITIGLEAQKKVVLEEQYKLKMQKQELERLKLEHAGQTEKEINAILQMRKELGYEKVEIEKLRASFAEKDKLSNELSKKLSDLELELEVKKKELEIESDRLQAIEANVKKQFQEVALLQNEATLKKEEAEHIVNTYERNIKDSELSRSAKDKAFGEKEASLEADYKNKLEELRKGQLKVSKDLESIEKREKKHNERVETFEIKEGKKKVNVK